VVEGGGMRGIFSAGVLDTFIQNDFNPFDICIGVSAGAVNVAAYLAGMYQRNYRVYTRYCTRPEFISFKKYLLGGHLMDLDWLWATTVKEIRLDLKKIMSSPTQFLIVVTSVETGKAIYLQPDESTCEDYLKASSAVPFAYRSMPIVGSRIAVDGGFADSIPVIEAYTRGAHKIMVVRSRPASHVQKTTLADYFQALLCAPLPGLRKAILQRAAAYMKAVHFVRNPPEGVEIIDIAPPGPLVTGRFTVNKAAMDCDYRTGCEMGAMAMTRWSTDKGIGGPAH
jgi:predicted patatin/cPLA2 family phospholipase